MRDDLVTHDDCELGADGRLVPVFSQELYINFYATEGFQAGEEDLTIVPEAVQKHLPPIGALLRPLLL